VSHGNAQMDSTFTRHKVYATLGGIGLVNAGLSYEYLFYRELRLRSSLQVFAPAFYTSDDDLSITTVSLDGVLLTSHPKALELGVGMGYALGREENDTLYTVIPRFFMGYRSEKSILFRAGIGFPEIFYLSIGF